MLWIRIGHKVDPNSVSDPDLGFWIEKCKALQTVKNPIFYQKNCNLFIKKPPWRTFKLRKKPRPSEENIQHFKTWNFWAFSIFMGHFCSPLPALGGGSGSSRTQLMRIRIHNAYLKQLQIAYCICIMHHEKYKMLKTRESTGTYKALRLQNTLLLKM